MNCDPSLTRYICFPKFLDDEKIQKARFFGIINPIVRKHSEGYELDFRFQDESGITELSVILGTTNINRVEDDFSHLRTGEILSKATAMIKEERYWESHNLLEELWKRNTGAKKKLIHDIIGIIVSQVKVQMDQWDVGKRVYERSYSQLNLTQGDAIMRLLPQNFAYPLKFSLETLDPILE
jgi:hypothetical protein